MVNDKRAKGIDSAFRDTSVESNLRMFNNMKLGMYKEGEYVLRLKVNFKSIAFKIWQ
jgi:glutaminyl-tRNA synthetase